MTTHELATLLLAGPDVHAVVDGFDGGFDDVYLTSVIARPSPDAGGCGGGIYDDRAFARDGIPEDFPAVCICRVAPPDDEMKQ